MNVMDVKITVTIINHTAACRFKWYSMPSRRDGCVVLAEFLVVKEHFQLTVTIGETELYNIEQLIFWVVDTRYVD